MKSDSSTAFQSGLLALLAFGAIAWEADAATDGQLRVTGGIIEGKVMEDGMRVFKGIPFAAPPTGELRWKAPQAVLPWEGIRQAKDFGPAPEQGRALAALLGVPNRFNEDCLHLNVWTKASAASDKLPVMVWIYGGAFMNGSSSTPLYDGTRLASKGAVIVTINYRIGPLGFLAHPELGKEAGGVSGNYGILDQIAALRWVKENIASFGGDPGCITIFGESAGAFSVAYLASSPLAKGLFHRAIAQSGGSFAPGGKLGESGTMSKTLQAAEAEGQAFLKKLGVGSIAEARSLPAKKIVATSSSGGPGTAPVFDGKILPGDLHGLYQRGRFNDTPILIGNNSDEAAMFIFGSVSPADFVKQARERLGDSADGIVALYPHSSRAEATLSRKQLVADAAFSWHTWTWAGLQATKGKNDAYVYYFDHRPDPESDGANHAAEIAYVFANPPASGIFSKTPQSEDQATAETLSSYWVNFAKHGNPNGDGLPEWFPFTKSAPRAMLFGTETGMGSLPYAKRMRAWDSFFAGKREEASSKP
ncbi:carboxylesterase family protein [Luteolibacter sp. GHJ8]|uniref:Carboxylic ester hydrolase n=1 Tax=Luteolibacter rhizosphaerae TaxID=2989719 RepID=A0ABT3FXK8_9BACT|nr:carboxylesterase family protein [Luteolibacter rhizosphaerae]MCW1912300.1 carboxylesterase family protein [Luteolibacter rhizosphaerae]